MILTFFSSPYSGFFGYYWTSVERKMALIQKHSTRKHDFLTHMYAISQGVYVLPNIWQCLKKAVMLTPGKRVILALMGRGQECS